MPQFENTILDIVLQETDADVLKQRKYLPALSLFVNNLIVHRFDELISLLYRLDISEQKLKTLLQQHASQDAADTIAGLIIERQEQRIKSRSLFKINSDLSDEEKW